MQVVRSFPVYIGLKDISCKAMDPYSFVEI